MICQFCLEGQLIEQLRKETITQDNISIEVGDIPVLVCVVCKNTFITDKNE